MSQSDTSGLIVSLPEPIIDRIFHHRDIYVHPNSEAATFLKLGNRLFFYDVISRAIIGEAVVSRMASETWARVSEYGNELFLSSDELERYVRENGMSKDERMLVLELEEAIKYMNPMRCPLPIPSSGLRVTRAVFDEITSANR